MAGRRLLYLVVLEGCLIFYLSYQEWFSWLLLVAALLFPLFSLLLSLPAMLTLRARLVCPARIPMGVAVAPTLQTRCLLPAPPVRCRLFVRHSITGSQRTVTPGDGLPTNHCGTLELSEKRLWVYDYLGLFRLRRKLLPSHRLAVLPQPLPMTSLPALERSLSGSFRPKVGGGFSEHHELRLYRPGDDLRRLHWKLSAKTGKLIYREPVEPRRELFTLSLVLQGDADTLDRLLGRFLWAGQTLLERDASFRVRCLTGRGLETFRVETREGLESVLLSLLAAPMAQSGTLAAPKAAGWHCSIGGGPDEI